MKGLPRCGSFFASGATFRAGEATFGRGDVVERENRWKQH
jgi:hypothetical protein